MPTKPRFGVVASKRYVQLFTPQQHAEYTALARHAGLPLAEIIRRLLEREIERAEKRDGVRLRRRKRVAP